MAMCLIPLLRITPACAGKTRKADDVIWKVADHPRVCGENSYRALSRLPRRGSPPRVRGKLEPDDEEDDEERITPACAGKTRIS